MGSRSESCGFSGMEIGEGEVAYVLLLGKPKYANSMGAADVFEPVTTLIRGTYGDYGYLDIEDDQAVLDIFNTQVDLELKQGDSFSIDHMQGKDLHRYWVHGLALDWMPQIKQDFPYFSTRRGGYSSEKVKNIGESADRRLAEIRAAHHEGREEYAARMRAYEAHEDKAALIEAALSLSRFSLTEIFGYSEDRVGYSALFQKMLRENVENIDGALEAYRRNYLLTYAVGELRKKFVPSEGVGPQHGGEQASRQFARFLLAAQAERSKRWEN